MDVAIVKYNAGNIFSVDHALRRLGIEPRLTDDKETLLKADKVIFPGVGEARSTMEHLRETRLDQLIRELKQPVLGICLGMQLLCSHSEEGDTDCLGIFSTPVLRFHPQQQEDKVPHTGWNTFRPADEELFRDMDGERFAYFVHSYYVPLNPYTAAQTEYIVPFSSALHKDNFYATQFHPEKSGETGEQILRNFLETC